MSVYLDYAATAPLLPDALKAMEESLRENYGNPSSLHPPGRKARAALEADRAAVAQALGALPEELFFTSGGTESDAWALRAAAAAKGRRGRHIVSSAAEHDAVRENLLALEREGFEVTFLSPDREGHIAPAAVAEAIREDTCLVSLMLINNETGSRLPVEAAAQAIREKGSHAFLHTDAVQAFLKVPFTPALLGADMVSICAHKIGGPKGIGALWIKKSRQSEITPLLRGGGQERGLRSGTEPTAQTAGFAAAVRAWKPGDAEKIGEVKEYALSRLAGIRGIEILTRGDAPHLFSLSLPAFSGQSIAEALGGIGICISSGSACHRGKPSRVYAAMPLTPKQRYGAVRISLGPETGREDIDALVSALTHIAEKQTLLF